MSLSPTCHASRKSQEPLSTLHAYSCPPPLTHQPNQSNNNRHQSSSSTAYIVLASVYTMPRQVRYIPTAMPPSTSYGFRSFSPVVFLFLPSPSPTHSAPMPYMYSHPALTNASSLVMILIHQPIPLLPLQCLNTTPPVSSPSRAKLKRALVILFTASSLTLLLLLNSPPLVAHKKKSMAQHDMTQHGHTSNTKGQSITLKPVNSSPVRKVLRNQLSQGSHSPLRLRLLRSPPSVNEISTTVASY